VQFNRIQFLRLVIVSAIAVFSARNGVASYIEYSWSGTLVPIGSDDPWQIGEQGKPFEILILVATDASDDLDQSIKYAGFFANYVRLRLDDIELPPSGELFIDFTDNHGNLPDLVSFAGYFEQFGNSLDIGTVVGLAPNTFTFLHALEVPPLFEETINLDRSAFGTQLYTGVVAKGAAVRAVPEGDSHFAIGFAAIAFFFMAQKRHSPLKGV
jgi:hypothetical protein